MTGILGENAADMQQIALIHDKEQVVPVIIAPCELHCGFALAADPVPRKLPACRGIDRIADLLPADGTGGNGMSFQPVFLQQIFQNEFAHRAAADVPVANEHYFQHCC